MTPDAARSSAPAANGDLVRVTLTARERGLLAGLLRWRVEDYRRRLAAKESAGMRETYDELYQLWTRLQEPRPGAGSHRGRLRGQAT